MPDVQFADPAVSRRKFNREIRQFRSKADDYGRRGWILAHASFPHALVILATAKTQPISILCGVWFDYSNYDAAPPSVRLVHPLTREPYRWSDVPTRLTRSSALPDAPPVTPPGVLQVQQLAVQHLMQAHGDDEIPFLCLAGVREYHDHPAHSGDRWELHRTSGAGRLVRLLEIISRYGVDTINGFDVQLVSKVGFQFIVPPE